MIVSPGGQHRSQGCHSCTPPASFSETPPHLSTINASVTDSHPNCNQLAVDGERRLPSSIGIEYATNRGMMHTGHAPEEIPCTAPGSAAALESWRWRRHSPAGRPAGPCQHCCRESCGLSSSLCLRHRAGKTRILIKDIVTIFVSTLSARCRDGRDGTVCLCMQGWQGLALQ